MSTIYGGGARKVVIWIDEDADEATAEQILQAVQDRSSKEQCFHCGYSLSGHSGEVNCPECGRQVYAPQSEITCHHCGEESPGTFEVCWNCGKPLLEATES